MDGDLSHDLKNKRNFFKHPYIYLTTYLNYVEKSDNIKKNLKNF